MPVVRTGGAIMVKAKWTGTYPCLCYGEWKLRVDGKDVSKKIPKDKRDKPMHTFGIYSKWHFENWQEVFEDYEDGLQCDDWIKENIDWVSKITSDRKVQEEIFNAIQSEDFRWHSCGGCI